MWVKVISKRDERRVACGRVAQTAGELSAEQAEEGPEPFDVMLGEGDIERRRFGETDERREREIVTLGVIVERLGCERRERAADAHPHLLDEFFVIELHELVSEFGSEEMSRTRWVVDIAEI